MCGRFTLGTPLSQLMEFFGIAGAAFDWTPRWNVAPTQEVPVVVADSGGGRRMGPLRWGLVPFWARDPSVGSRMINARSETVAEKPAFRQAFARRRCLVPADGFYEWEKQGEGGKVPHYIHRPGREPFAMAGLWERWGEEPLYTFTILTREATPDLRFIHPRMPVVVPPEEWDPWLRGERTDPPEGVPAGYFQEHPVSTRVNAPANDDPGLIEPV